MSDLPSDKPDPAIDPEATEPAIPALAIPLASAGDVTTDFDQQVHTATSEDAERTIDSAASGPSVGSGGGPGSGSGSASNSSLRRLAGASGQALPMVADYQLKAKLGEGGMGRVYRAVDRQGREVAIKLLSQQWACSSDALQRFKQEGYIASQINHPHCVFVHRVDEDRGTPFIAMELMTGQTLKDLVLQSGPLPYKEAVRLILQCIDGLIEAHRQGMIHRDIKPANCYLDDQHNVKIGDFGLARSLVDDSELTRTGAFLGTPLFASPEQLLGHKIDERSDIYSLSATLYYLLAGRAPFESPNAAQVIAKIASSDPPSFSEAGVTLPKGLEAIVKRGLARDRNKRYETFGQLRAALQPIVTPEREVAGFPRRLLAWFIDATLFSTISGIFMLMALGLASQPLTWEVSPLVGVSFSSAMWFLYLWLPECLFGSTIGKRLMRLRVVDSQTGGPQRWKMLAIRAGVVVLATNVIEFLFYAIFGNGYNMLGALAAWSSQLFGALFLMGTWWHTERRQLTHEWLSHTLTNLAVPQRSSEATKLVHQDWHVPLIKPEADLPKQIGRFVIQGRLPTRDGSDWFAAHDASLDRDVWVQWLPNGAPPLSPERKNCTRPIRMRVIDSGSEAGRNWEAFLAPEGVPLGICLDQGTYLPWPIARQMFYQLNQESSTASRPSLEITDWHRDRFWLDAAGRLVFAETALELGTPQRDESLQSLLKYVACAALPVRHKLRRKQKVSADSSSTGRIAALHSAGQPSQRSLDKSSEQKTVQVAEKNRAKLPSIAELPTYRAMHFLGRVAAGSVPIEQVPVELKKVDDTVDQVTGALRLAHALTVAVLISPLFLMIMLFLSLHIVDLVSELRKEYVSMSALSGVLESPEQHPLAFEGLTPEQRTEWLQPARVSQVKAVTARRRAQLKQAYDQTSFVEQSILSTVGMDAVTLASEPSLDALLQDGEASEPSGSSASSDATASDAAAPANKRPGSIRIRSRGPTIEIGGLKSHSLEIRGLVKSLSEQPKLFESDRWPKVNFPNMPTILIPWSIFLLWTGLTRGGLVQIFTGVSVVRRDGCRASRLRCIWRSVLLYLPFAVLAVLILQTESMGGSGLWWGSQFKRVALVLPLLYSAATLIWPQCGPHDRLSYTAVVPR